MARAHESLSCAAAHQNIDLYTGNIMSISSIASAGSSAQSVSSKPAAQQTSEPKRTHGGGHHGHKVATDAGLSTSSTSSGSSTSTALNSILGSNINTTA
jgi:hypothetical protein